MSDEQQLKPGDYVLVNGRRALVVHRPLVVVLYEDLGIHEVPIRFVERTDQRPDIRTEDLMRARDRWPEPKHDQ